MDVSQSSSGWMASMNEDSTSSLTKSSIMRKPIGIVAGAAALAPPNVFEDNRDRQSFYKDLYSYHDNKGYHFIFSLKWRFLYVRFLL